MKSPRIVLDTNVVVSAMLKPKGLESLIIELVTAKQLILCVSTAIMAEYRSVLARPKFDQLDPIRIGRLFDLLQIEATTVAPKQRITESQDEADNRFLECAEEADADYLITGNRRHFPASWKRTKIVNTREFVIAAGLTQD